MSGWGACITATVGVINYHTRDWASMMAEDQGDKEREKPDFDSASEAIDSVSLDRPGALKHARDNREPL